MSRDRGSMTIWVAATMALIWLVATGALAYGTVVIGRHRVETAADLAALAGAGRVADGQATACVVAATVSARNGGELGTCRLIGDDIQVLVTRRVGLGRPGVHTATAAARAGPVDRGDQPPRT